MYLSKRIQKLKASPTLALDGKVKKLQKEGRSIINLTIGEPYTKTPAYICKAGISAIRDGFTHYTPPAGIEDLRIEVAKKLHIENNISYDPENIVIGVGTKQLLYSIFQVLCDRGDEVILGIPTWSTYIEQITLAEAVPKMISLKPPFVLMASEIDKQITPKTKIILLNSPANPTGSMISKTELNKIASLAKKHNLMVVSDEIYEHITYTQKHVSIASLSDDARRRTITVSGFSKSYAMTGWRVGYAAGSKDIIQAISDLNSQITSGTSSISQKAAVAAYKAKSTHISQIIKAYKNRRELVVKRLSEIEKIDFTAPAGTFYVFVNLTNILRKSGGTSETFCMYLLEKYGVAIVPGEAFCAPGYARISFATTFGNLREGLECMQTCIEDIFKNKN